MAVLKSLLLVQLLFLTATLLPAEARRTDPRTITYEGIPLEGHADTLVTALRLKGYTQWGTEDDGETLHFRGNYYGLRIKLMVSLDHDSRLVSSALVTCGPYYTKDMLQRNTNFFLGKLYQDYGRYVQRDSAYYFVTDYGMVKVSSALTERGARELRVFYYNSAPFYKDAAGMGLKGHVQEVVTTNPVSEGAMEQFDKTGRTKRMDLQERQYDVNGYLTHASMAEAQGGQSQLDYEYDSRYRLVRRTLLNAQAGIRYVNEYTYTDDDEIGEESQRVFDATGECILSVNLKNHYEAHDDEGNWTLNKLELVYWEKNQQPQSTTVEQKRTIKYWED